MLGGSVAVRQRAIGLVAAIIDSPQLTVNGNKLSY